jgi:hydrogenase maturation protease
MAEVLVIGIGNEYARDDAAGLLVARALKAQGWQRVKVLEQSGEGAALIEAWQGSELVIVIDAARSGGAPGIIRRFDAGREPLPAHSFRGSTHALGLYEAVEVSRSLNQLPRRLIVYAIDGTDFAPGIGLTPNVERAISVAVRVVDGEIRPAAGAEPP